MELETKVETNAVASEDPKALKKEKRKKRRKKARKVLLIILAVILAFVLITTCVTVVNYKSLMKKAKNFGAAGSKKLNFEYYDDNNINIYSDDGLKIVQLTDIHIGSGWMSGSKDNKAMNAVAAMVKAEKPDLVVVTGDVGYPVPFQAGTFNNKLSIRVFAELMETLDVYWLYCFGNHDTELYSYYSREDIVEMLDTDEYPHCLLKAGPSDVDGLGNQIVNIVNSDGVITRSLITLDSHMYTDGDTLGALHYYDNIHQNQVDWYSKTVDELNAKNEKTISSLSKEKQAEYENLKTVPTSLFFHIPLTEYKDAWDEYLAAGFKDTENVKYNYGTIGEPDDLICCGVHEDELFETALKKGSTDTVFCGHDHLNTFSVNYKGINLTYSYSIDYLAYPGISKIGSQRGCTVINIAKDGAISFAGESYYQDKYATLDPKEEVTMQKLGNH